MLDIIIKNARIIDGEGTPEFVSDITVKDGIIVAVEKTNQRASEIIDAEGMAAAPGFIDVHGHTDIFAFIDPDRSSKLCQGITTELCGQCGLGPAPISHEHYAVYEGYLGTLGAFPYPTGKDFTTFKAFLDFMETMPLGINTAYFLPHGTLRMSAMGLSPESPSQKQLYHMKSMIREGMEAGALGLSSGLGYAPGMFADEAELTALCTVVGEFGGIYSSHVRNQGRLIEACVEETIRVAKNSNSRANIAHTKASGKMNWGKIPSLIKMIHEADIEVMHDVYPYTATSTILRATLPPYLQQLTPQSILEYLKNPQHHAELKNAIFDPSADFESPLYDCGYGGLMIFNPLKTKDVAGKSIEQYAAEKGMDPFDAYLSLLIENELSAGYIGFSISENDVEKLLADPLCMIGTDALYVQGMPVTHPRAIGTFPRVLGRYVREAKLITLEEAIRKMTSLPARFYGLHNKGILRAGMDADIVVFDSEKITDHADYHQSLLPNEGIHRVIVNGKTAVSDDKALGIRNGKVLRASR